ncbi:MAG: tetratricopeptide repeat protein [Candidatus Obscuribacterales bacterium]
MPAQTASSNLEQADLLARAGRFEEAVPLYESSLSSLESLNGLEAPELAECLQNLADAYQSVGRYDESLRANWRLVKIGERILGRVHPDMVSMLLKIAETNEMMGKTEDALHIVESAITTAKQCMQADNPLAVRLIERHTYLVNLMRNQGAVRSQYDDPSQYQKQNQVLNQEQIAQAMPEALPNAAPANIPEQGQPSEPQVHKQVLKQVQQQIQNQLQQQAAATNTQLGAITNGVNPMEISQGQLGETAMQAFAREMLKDMPSAPGSKTGFSQSAKYNETSGVHYPQVNAQEALALNPSLVPMPSPPERTNGSEAKASYGNALAQRPESQEYDQYEEPEEEPYTAEAIASLTNRSKINTRSNAKGRRLSSNEQSRIRTGRIFKDFAIPAIAVVVMVGLVLYLFSGKTVKPPAAVKGSTAAYEAPDQKKQLRLLAAEVVIINPSATTKINLKRVKSNWGDLLAALALSATEKQIWMADNSSSIKSEDGITYYLSGGPDSRVIEKMRQLANFAQVNWLSNGEYPRTIPAGAEYLFAYSCPYNGKAMNIQIISDRTNDKDGSDIKLSLEGGVHLSNKETSQPGYIGCYTALYNENNALKSTKFFVRGSNRDGRFLTTDNDQIFVLDASNQPSSTPASTEKPIKAASKNLNRSKRNSRRGAKQKEPLVNEKASDKASENSAAVSHPKELATIANAKAPEKPTTVYLMSEPMLPLGLMHHLLPIFLGFLAALAFIRARMVGFDIKGEEVASGSKAAFIIGIIFAVLTLLVVFLQFSVFA